MDLKVLRELDHGSELECTGEWRLPATNQCRPYLDQNGSKAWVTQYDRFLPDPRTTRHFHMGARVKA